MAKSMPAKRTGRPPLTDRSMILAAARSIGLARLTVGAVTAEVGIRYSTFYRHFPSFEALSAALVNDLLEEFDLPEPRGRWQDFLSAVSRELVVLYERHPGTAPSILSLPELPTRLLQVYAAMTDLMIEHGFGDGDAVLAASMVIELTITPFLTVHPETAGSDHRRVQAHNAIGHLDPQVRDATATAVDDLAEIWVGRKIDLLIDGLEARIARVGRIGPPRRSPSSRPDATGHHGSALRDRRE